MTDLFRPAFMGSPSFSVKPITLAVMHDDIPPDELTTALKNAVPQGFVGTSPYVVKTLDGEYLVYADGTAQFVPLGNSPGERVALNGFGNIPIVNSGVMLGRLDSIRCHLGQEAAPSNQLLDVRVNVLLSRGALLIPPVLKDVGYSTFVSNIMRLLGIPVGRGLGYSGEAVQARFLMPPGIWTEEEMEDVSTAAAAPNNEELQDVALIDSLYKWPLGGTIPQKIIYWGGGGGKVVERVLDEIVCGREWGIRRGYVGPGVDDPFYCSGASQEGYFRFRGWPTTAVYFGLKPDETWGDQRLATHNAKVFSDELRTYPFPGPIPLAPGFWYEANRKKLAEFVNSGLIFDEFLARLFITGLVVDTITAVSEQIISWAEKRAKKKQKWAIIRIAGAVALGIIFSAALAPALASILPAGVPISGATAASAITSFAQDKFTEAELERMSKELEEAAKIFEVNDPAFAEQLRIANSTLGYIGGELETSADTLSQMDEQAQNPPPTPDEFGVNTEYPESSPLQKALLGAGAGVGVAGLLLFLLR